MSQFKVLLLLMFFLPAGVIADDHIDGPTLNELAADLAGIYVFPSPEDPDSLTLVMNASSGVLPGVEFDPRSKFEMQIHSLNLVCSDPSDANCKKEATQSHNNTQIEHQLALKIECVADRGHIPIVQHVGVTCQFTNASGKVLDSVHADSRWAHHFSFGKVFAGKKADPFFISIPVFNDVVFYNNRFGTISSNGIINNQFATNGIRNVNVMSIVIEIDTEKAGLKSGLYGVAAQSYLWRKVPGTHNHIHKKVDRAGRAELVNVALHDTTQVLFSGRGQSPIKRNSNLIEIFDGPSHHKAAVYNRLAKNIKRYDSLDNVKDWSEENIRHLSNIMKDDYIMINLNEDCAQRTNTDYFGIERNILNGEPITSCGGRDLHDDIFAKSYSMYIAGPNSDPNNFTTGVNEPYQSFSDAGAAASPRFPYLMHPVRYRVGETFAGLRLFCQNQEFTSVPDRCKKYYNNSDSYRQDVLKRTGQKLHNHQHGDTDGHHHH